jgi:hypothetical protein
MPIAAFPVIAYMVRRCFQLTFLSVAFCAGAAISGGADFDQTSQNEQRVPAHKEYKPTGGITKDTQTMNKMMVEHLGPADADYEKRLVDMMIPHHEGAVLMARDAMRKSKRPEIREMAEQMIEERTKKIERLKSLRAEWYDARGPKKCATVRNDLPPGSGFGSACDWFRDGARVHEADKV